MADPLRKPGAIPHSGDGRPGPASAHAAPAALIQDLRRLRQWALERLDSLEARARQRPAPAAAAGGMAALEPALQQRLAELEEARRRLCAEAERQEKEWGTALAQLEADRRLLAEAWERLERHRIEGLGASERPPHHPHAQGPGSPRGAVAACPHPATTAPAPARAVRSDPDPNNPVAEAILRQFQTLCRDVRCNAETRRDPL